MKNERKFCKDYFKNNKGDEVSSWEFLEELYYAYSKGKISSTVKNMSQCADYLGISSTELSRYFNAVKFNEKYNLNYKYNVRKTYVLSTLGARYETFEKYAKRKGVDINNIPLRELEKMAVRYKGTGKKKTMVKIEIGNKKYVIPQSVLNKYEV